MLKDGYTLMHEHIFIDLSGVKKLDDCRLDCKDETIEEFKELYKNGVRNITEVTNIGMGRDINYIREVSEKSGINVICATGFYKEPFYPEFVYENSRNHPMNELFTIMIDVYLKKGEKEKALDVFNKNKKIIKYWMPPANYVQLSKRLGVIW